MNTINRYDGKVINIIRKMLKMSYADISDHMGISVSHYNKIISGERFLERTRSASTLAVYNSLYKQAIEMPRGEAIFSAMCELDGVARGSNCE